MSPAAASPFKSVSSTTSSFLPPSAPAKRSPASLMTPFTAVGPEPPGTAAPSCASKSASSVPDSRPMSLPANGPRGPMSMGGLTWRATLVGIGVSVTGSGAVFTRTSRFCLSARTAALSNTSRGFPERRSLTSTSRCWTASSFAPRVALSMNATFPSRSAAWSTRRNERSDCFSSFAFFSELSASLSWKRCRFVVPSDRRSTLTVKPCTSAEWTCTLLPPEKSARSSATRTSTRSRATSGTSSPEAAPIWTSETRTPSPVRSFVATPPICTGRPHSCDSSWACSLALEVRIPSRTKERMMTRTTTTATTIATAFCQRFIGRQT